MKRHIGEVYYVVKVTLNSFDKKKMFCTDEDGNQWYRYDKPNRSYEVKKYEIVGKLEKTLSGDFDRIGLISDEDIETEYFVKDSEGSVQRWYEYDFSPSVCFISESNAVLKKISQKELKEKMILKNVKR